MPDSLFWHDLAGDFEKLPQTLFIQWQFTSGSPGHHKYSIDGGSELLRRKFERLARRAGAAVDPHREQDPVEFWLDELRKLDKDPRNRGELLGPEIVDGNQVYYQLGKIPNAAEASPADALSFKWTRSC